MRLPIIARLKTLRPDPYQMVNRIDSLDFSHSLRDCSGHMQLSLAAIFFPLTLLSPIAAVSDQASGGDALRTDGARIYRSLEERREAGVGIPVADWLTISGLLEVELGQRRDKVQNAAPELRDDVFSSSVQLGFEAVLAEFLKAEALFNAEWDDGQRTTLDEAFLSLDFESLEIEAGRLYPPFGEFYSYFVTGPLLEFGETRGTALVASYGIADTAEVSFFVLDGETDGSKKKSDSVNFGFGIDLVSEHRVVKAGGAYLYDLADASTVSEFDFVNVERNRVGGLTGYVLLGVGSIEISAEIVGAIHEFEAFDEEVNRPVAWNLEVAYGHRPSLLFALRFEGSDELPDEPERQVGLAATWRMNKYASVSAEYLFGRYKDDFVFDDGGNALTTRRQFGVQISVQF